MIPKNLVVLMRLFKDSKFFTREIRSPDQLKTHGRWDLLFPWEPFIDIFVGEKKVTYSLEVGEFATILKLANFQTWKKC